MSKLKIGMALLSSLFVLSPVYAEHVSFEISDKGINFNSGHHKKRLFWETYRGRLPADAIVGGQEMGRLLYICQAPYMGGVHPGKMVDRRCNITYAGREIQQPRFSILVGRHAHWERSSYGRIPGNAVAGGYENGRPLYICQAHVQGGVHPGKVVGGRCNIGYGGQEISKKHFQILVNGRDDRPIGSVSFESDDFDDDSPGAEVPIGRPAPSPGAGVPIGRPAPSPAADVPIGRAPLPSVTR